MTQQQNWNAEEYKEHAAYVSTLASGVVDLLSPVQGEHILDLGCGDGKLACELEEQGCSVIGIDSSESMIQSSQDRGLEAYVVDGHDINFKNEFDAVFSNATLHWLTEPERVVKGVYTALKDTGRFVGEFGGYGNIGALLKAMKEVFDENPDFGKFEYPWFFPTVAEYKSILEQEGFKVNYIELIPRPTPLESGVTKWLEIFAEGISAHLNSEQKKLFLTATKNKLTSVLYTEENGWVADYVRLRFAAVKI